MPRAAVLLHLLPYMHAWCLVRPPSMRGALAPVCVCASQGGMCARIWGADPAYGTLPWHVSSRCQGFATRSVQR